MNTQHPSCWDEETIREQIQWHWRCHNYPRLWAWVRLLAKLKGIKL